MKQKVRFKELSWFKPNIMAFLTAVPPWASLAAAGMAYRAEGLIQ